MKWGFELEWEKYVILEDNITYKLTDWNIDLTDTQLIESDKQLAFSQVNWEIIDITWNPVFNKIFVRYIDANDVPWYGSHAEGAYRLPLTAFRQQNRLFELTTAYWLLPSDGGWRMADGGSQPSISIVPFMPDT